MIEAYPKISIVTASYNQARFIDQAIKSVIDQDYPNFEHIIFDNCSTDGTIDILKKYPHLTWTSEPDNGQSDALNKGFRKASGEFVGWLNADDLYLPGCFRSVTKTFNEHSECGVVYGDYRWIDEDGNLTKLCREIDFDLFIFKYLHVSHISSVSTFFRGAILKEGDLLNTDYHYSMDYELLLRLALKGYGFVHLRSFLADFRWHPQSKSELNKRRQIEEKDQALFLHDKFMREIYGPARPIAQVLLILAARAKRTLLKLSMRQR